MANSRKSKSRRGKPTYTLIPGHEGHPVIPLGSRNGPFHEDFHRVTLPNGVTRIVPREAYLRFSRGAKRKGISVGQYLENLIRKAGFDV